MTPPINLLCKFIAFRVGCSISNDRHLHLKLVCLFEVCDSLSHVSEPCLVAPWTEPPEPGLIFFFFFLPSLWELRVTPKMGEIERLVEDFAGIYLLEIKGKRGQMTRP